MGKRAIAVVGAGYWGKNLVRNFNELGSLRTICDGAQSVRTQMQKNYPEIKFFSDFDAVLNDSEILAVVIAAPAVLHYELAQKAILSGKDVFVEKPLSLTYADGEKLVQLAEDHKKILFVGHILQYHAAVSKLKEMVNDGQIGRLQYIYSRRLSLGKIRREENILWSFAPHDISVILSLVGEDPYYVDSVGSNFLHARIADVTMTNLKFPSGIGAHIFVSWLNPFKEQKLVVVGSHGMLVFDDTQGLEEKLILYPHVIDWQNNMPIPKKGESIPIDLSEIWEEPLKSECRAFLRALETRETPITSGAEGLRVLKILETSQKSLEEKADAQPIIKKVPPEIKQSEIENLNYFVHPTAIVDDQVAVGKGTKIWHFSHILSNCRIGENCNVGQNVVIGPDVTIGNKCKIQNNVSVYKGVTLEDGVFCGPSMVFTNIYNPRAEISKMDKVRSTMIKKGVTIGANATIVCGHTIGRYAFIGAGAVVTKDVLDHALIIGNPAKQIGWMCRCGEKLDDKKQCKACGQAYVKTKNGLKEKYK